MGLPGVLLFASGAVLPGLAQGLSAAGAAVLPADVADTLRVEAGEPAFHVDMDGDTIPTEAGIEATAVSYLKGCFPGQEVLVRIRDRGHGKIARKLVGLTVEGDAVPPAGSAITGGEKEIGRVTSAVMSPALGKPIALGYVHRDFVAPGTRVAVVIGDAGADATVAELPFVRVSSRTSSSSAGGS
jgi:aminomethyltransferase